MAQTSEVTLSHSPIYLFIYSSVSYSHLLNQIYNCNSSVHFCVNWLVYLDIVVLCDRKDLIPSILLAHRENSLKGEQEYSKTKVIIDVLCMRNLLGCFSCVSIQIVSGTLATLKNQQNEEGNNLIPIRSISEHSFILQVIHCVKSVPYFRAFGLNTGRYRVSFHIQSECGKMQTRITPNTNTFYALTVLKWNPID